VNVLRLMEKLHLLVSGVRERYELFSLLEESSILLLLFFLLSL
jgi:hypothetical protein